jgi:hypothetical protein
MTACEEAAGLRTEPDARHQWGLRLRAALAAGARRWCPSPAESPTFSKITAEIQADIA